MAKLEISSSNDKGEKYWLVILFVFTVSIFLIVFKMICLFKIA